MITEAVVIFQSRYRLVRIVNFSCKKNLMPPQTRAQAQQQIQQPSMINNSNYNESASVSLFASISASILRSVNPSEVAKFLKERERYKLDITSKQSELPPLKMLPYKASIDHQILNNLFFMGKFDKIAQSIDVGKLKDDHAEIFVKAVIDKKYVLYDPTVIK